MSDHLNASNPVAEFHADGTVVCDDSAVASRLTNSLKEYLGCDELTADTLEQIVVNGLRVLVRADADATTMALRDTRDDVSRLLSEVRGAIAQERAAMRAETDQVQSMMLAAVQTALSQVNSVVTSTPNQAVSALMPVLTQFQDTLTTSASSIMDPMSPNGAGASLAHAVKKSLDDHADRLGTRFADMEAKLGIAEARAEERSKSSAKGFDFEYVLRELLSDFAQVSQLKLLDTSTETGAVSGSKKGDFLLLDGDVPLVVVEAKNRSSGTALTQIHRELDETTRNRAVSVAVWIVNGRDQCKGELVSQLSNDRWIVAWEEDNADIIPAVMRFAVATARRAQDSASGDTEKALTKVNEALNAVKDLSMVVSYANNVLKASEELKEKTASVKMRIVTSLNDAAEALST